MDLAKFENTLKIGETVAVEFKRAGGTIESDTFETVCSFSNRFGGDIYLGVLDNGSVVGVPEKAAIDMVKNIINVANNPTLFQPTTYLDPEIVKYKGKTIIRIHVPPSSEVHSFKRVVYDRVNESDVKVTSTSQIAQMFIRKQGIFTEQRIYPYLKKENLRLDLLDKVRLLAINNAGGNHPWKEMDDETLLKSAGLCTIDFDSGKPGFNLAAALLLGRDEVIHSICPTYRTDALLRRENVDRYDDRDIVETNLIDSYERLFAFAQKHLPDKFFVEDSFRKSLRNIIVREMISNTLMHREFTSSFQAQFIIERNRMFVKNANRSPAQKTITPENLEPKPKNPTIASFFRNIGFADQLGSGTRKMFKYGKLYSGVEPKFIEDDVFCIIQPLNENYSFDADNERGGQGTTQKSSQKSSQKGSQKSSQKILSLITENTQITTQEMADLLNISRRAVAKQLANLQTEGIVKRVGPDKGGHWEIHEKENSN